MTDLQTAMKQDFRAALRDIYNRAWERDDCEYADWIARTYSGILSFCTVCEYAYDDDQLVTYAPIMAPICESCLDSAEEIFA